ncbi:MAG: sigma-70 family RNA polymerase sigma factor [Acidobacteriia bacterium]|nr:sigma-70 family RNA polymerase sigma factor [Terriglobia bacterium]
MDGVCLELAGQVGSSQQAEPEAERTLIRRAQRGDRAAFDALVRRYDQEVLRMALRIVRSPDEAQDLYQEAFLKVYRSIGQFRLEARFSTWLYRVVTNVCYDHLRRQKNRSEVQAPENEDGQPDFAQVVAEDRSALHPDRALAAGEISRRLEAALARLSPRERMVFDLKHCQGLKLRAIGEICGTSEEAAKNSLFRALQKLRVDLRDLV